MSCGSTLTVLTARRDTDKKKGRFLHYYSLCWLNTHHLEITRWLNIWIVYEPMVVFSIAVSVFTYGYASLINQLPRLVCWCCCCFFAYFISPECIEKTAIKIIFRKEFTNRQWNMARGEKKQHTTTQYLCWASVYMWTLLSLVTIKRAVKLSNQMILIDFDRYLERR